MDQIARSVAGGVAQGAFEGVAVAPGLSASPLRSPADVMEIQLMRDLLWRVRFRRTLHPRQATGDTTYGTVENIVVLEDEGIHANVPLPDMNHRRPFYGLAACPFDAAHDAFSCPAGHALVGERVKHTEGVIVDRADAATGIACPLQAKCTKSHRGRIIHRSLFADSLEKVRGSHTTEADTKAMHTREELLRQRRQPEAFINGLNQEATHQAYRHYLDLLD
jgi:hypothetical protein